jgi:hypothetical protein
MPVKFVTGLVRSEDVERVITTICPDAEFTKDDLEEIARDLTFVIGQYITDNADWALRKNAQPEWIAQDVKRKEFWWDRPDLDEDAATVRRLGEVQAAVEVLKEFLSARHSGLGRIDDGLAFPTFASAYQQLPRVGVYYDRRIEEISNYIDDLYSAIMLARHEFKPQKKSSGRRELRWHHEYTRFLLQFCSFVGWKPTKSRPASKPKRGEETVGYGGSLMRASRAFEACLLPPMRASDDEARFQRLKRSQAHLKRAEKGDKTGRGDS